MARSRSNSTKRGAFRPRNYKEEYKRRVDKALLAGKTRSAGRGHPTAADLPKPVGPIDRTSPLEKALRLMKHGASQNSAAKAEGISVEKLRLYREQNTASQRAGRTWTIFDLRPQLYRLASKGKIEVVTLAADDGSEVSAYWRAVDRFFDTRDAEHLRPFVGRGVIDVNGKFHQFETGPNTLRRMQSLGDLSFIDIYANTTAEV